MTRIRLGAITSEAMKHVMVDSLRQSFAQMGLAATNAVTSVSEFGRALELELELERLKPPAIISPVVEPAPRVRKPGLASCSCGKAISGNKPLCNACMKAVTAAIASYLKEGTDERCVQQSS